MIKIIIIHWIYSVPVKILKDNLHDKFNNISRKLKHNKCMSMQFYSIFKQQNHFQSFGHHSGNYKLWVTSRGINPHVR